MSNIKDEQFEYMISKIMKLKDHYEIGCICAHIHAHKRIIEYNTYAQILIMRLVN